MIYKVDISFFSSENLFRDHVICFICKTEVFYLAIRNIDLKLAESGYFAKEPCMWQIKSALIASGALADLIHDKHEVWID